MLSSIVNQMDLPSLLVTINCYEYDEFRNWNLWLLNLFSPKINIRFREFKTKKFQYRSYTRNVDILESKSKYLIFADGDCIFYPTFFNHLSTLDFGEKVIYGCRRKTLMDINESHNIVDSFNYDNILDISRLPYKKFKNDTVIAAGYFQLVSLNYLKENNMTYSDNFNDQPLLENGEYETWSDVTFRKKFKYKKSIERDIYHLNHYRSRFGEKDKLFNTKFPI